MILKCWERGVIWSTLRLKRQKSQGPGQARPCENLGLKRKWDGNVVIWFPCNGLERTRGESKRPLRRYCSSLGEGQWWLGLWQECYRGRIQDTLHNRLRRPW